MSEIETLWHVPLEAAICEVCDWAYLLPPDAIDAACPHCNQTTVTPLAPDEVIQLAPPELVVPFTAQQARMRTNMAQFVRGIRFSPPDLSVDTLRARLRPLYIPLWLVDSDVAAQWQAEVGYDYDVVSHEERYAGGSWQTIEKQETKVRWEQRVGKLQRRYENVSAPALEDQETLQKLLGRFQLDSAESYRSTHLGKAFVRLPNRLSADAWADAEPQFLERAADECRRAAAAQHLRHYQWRPTFSDRRWTHLLLPVYATYYRDDDGNPLPVLLNGQTGRISGRRRASMRQARRYTMVGSALALLLFALALVLLLLESTWTAPTALLAAVVALGSLFPIINVTQFNRTQREDWFAIQTQSKA